MERLDNLKVKSCCFFIPLRSAVTIIGFIWQLGGLLALAEDELPLILPDIFSNTYYHVKMALISTFIVPNAKSGHNYETIVHIIYFLVDVINIAIGTVLLIGVFRRKLWLLKTFCIMVLVMVTLEMSINIINEIYEVFGRYSAPSPQLLVYGCYFLQLYFVVVVKSFYHEMKEGLMDQGDQGGQGDRVLNMNKDNTQHQLESLDP